MDDPALDWRAALQDDSHPHHRLAWVIFPPTMDAARAARRLAADRDASIPLLLDILATPDFYDEASLGEGYAPIHAVELLSEWRAAEAVPHLIRILAEETWEAVVYDRATTALCQIGPPALDAVLAFAATAGPDQFITVGEVLAGVGQGDERAYAWVERRLKDMPDKDSLDFAFLVETLLSLDTARARPMVEALLRKQRFSPRVRQEIAYLLDEYG